MPKNIKKNNFSLFAPKNITFGNILTQKYRTYLPVCACTECPPGLGPNLHDELFIFLLFIFLFVAAVVVLLRMNTILRRIRMTYVQWNWNPESLESLVASPVPLY